MGVFLFCVGECMKKSKKPCTYPRCPKLTESTYCEHHQQMKQREQADTQRHYDKYQRDERSTSFYKSKAWRELRDVAFRRDNGLCVQCRNDKMIKVADVVDHIIPIKNDWNKRLDIGNLQSLCHSCHNKKTKAE